MVHIIVIKEQWNKPNGKTPGTDGFGCEMYKFFWLEKKSGI
jgi:hypothetical protein